MRNTSNITIIGLGNILLKDEGVGVHVANAVKERYTLSPEVEIIDGGTMGLDLLPFFEGRDKILLVDAVDFGREPGHVGMLGKGEIPAVLESKLSMHHISLSDVLFTASFMGIGPDELCLIGIQPESLDIGLDMTGTVGDKFETLVDMTINKLGDWNVECTLNASCDWTVSDSGIPGHHT
jgi:hydrogenase maturation protease